MKTLNTLMQEIIAITTVIETKYPELYKYLEETPMTICETKNTSICLEDLKKYLQTLKEQLQHHVEMHKN